MSLYNRREMEDILREAVIDRTKRDRKIGCEEGTSGITHLEREKRIDGLVLESLGLN